MTEVLLVDYLLRLTTPHLVGLSLHEILAFTQNVLAIYFKLYVNITKPEIYKILGNYFFFFVFVVVVVSSPTKVIGCCRSLIYVLTMMTSFIFSPVKWKILRRSISFTHSMHFNHQSGIAKKRIFQVHTCNS